MLKTYSEVCAAASAFAILVSICPDAHGQAACEGSPVDGLVVVRFGSEEAALPGSYTSAPIEEVTFTTSALEDSLVECGVTDLELLAPVWESLSAGDVANGLVDFSQVFVLSVDDTTNIEALIERLATFANVRAAQPMYASTTFTINDPDYPEQWHLENTEQDSVALPDVDLDAERAWETTLGSSSVTIHVIDTGVSHSDITENSGQSWDCATGNNEHGTSVAGIIGANANNSNVRGVAPNTQIGDVRISPGTAGSLECGMTRAAVFEARVANMSVGKLEDVFSVLAAAKNLYLSGDYGCLLVAAAGNLELTNGDHCPVYPAAYDNLALGVAGGREGRQAVGGRHLFRGRDRRRGAGRLRHRDDIGRSTELDYVRVRRHVGRNADGVRNRRAAVGGRWLALQRGSREYHLSVGARHQPAG
jgi:hypothetical protein